jgi:hypothetical protein
MAIAVAFGCSGGDDAGGMQDDGTGGTSANLQPGGAGSGGRNTGTSQGSGGTPASSGSASGGSSAASGSGGVASGPSGSGGADSGGGAGGGSDAGSTAALPHFSFFMTSYTALFGLAQDMGLPDGFGGDLRYGETGDRAGLRGADKICAAIAERSMPGSSAKQWRAFLSTSYENAIDRVGEGPWYDRVGRVFAMTKEDLLHERPANADAAIADDFPNEDGVLNHDPDGTGEVDNHEVLTGSNAMGMLYGADANCADWTSTDTMVGRPRVGHSWTREGFGGTGPGGGGQDGSFNHWISSWDEAGCGPGSNLLDNGGPDLDDPTVGSGGGYGAFYCFALAP